MTPGDTLDIALPDWEMWPYTCWLVFPGKLVAATRNNFYVSFTPTDKVFAQPSETDEYGGVCFERLIEMGQIIRCTYAGKNLAQAYELARQKYPQEAKHMRPALPANSLEYQSNVDEEDVFMVYRYNKEHTALADYSRLAAENLKKRFEGLILARLERPCYMLAPPMENVNLEDMILISHFLDAKTLVNSVCGFVPDESGVSYMAAFMDAGHAEAAGNLADFEAYWSGAKTDMRFFGKAGFGCEISFTVNQF